ncbi:hypothetical protein P8452_74237 [Trifolium repens]|nr:hypothetical protein P8452_74237 [Trifolium repens]
MEKNPKIHDWIVSYSAVLSMDVGELLGLMPGRTCYYFGSDTRRNEIPFYVEWMMVNFLNGLPFFVEWMLVNLLAEPAIVSGLIRAGALNNATAA